MFASRNKCIATSNKCLTSTNKPFKCFHILQRRPGHLVPLQASLLLLEEEHRMPTLAHRRLVENYVQHFRHSLLLTVHRDIRILS